MATTQRPDPELKWTAPPRNATPAHGLAPAQASLYRGSCAAVAPRWGLAQPALGGPHALACDLVVKLSGFQAGWTTGGGGLHRFLPAAVHAKIAAA